MLERLGRFAVASPKIPLVDMMTSTPLSAPLAANWRRWRAPAIGGFSRQAPSQNGDSLATRNSRCGAVETYRMPVSYMTKMCVSLSRTTSTLTGVAAGRGLPGFRGCGSR